MNDSLDRHATPSADDLARRNVLLGSVNRALEGYLRDVEPGRLFDGLLADLLALTGSPHGYIAELLHGADGPYLQICAASDGSSDEPAREPDREPDPEPARHGSGRPRWNPDALLGRGIHRRSVVIANDARNDTRLGPPPSGGLDLDSVCVIPIVREERLVGQVAIADRAGGYDASLVDFLVPFTSALGSLIDAFRADRERSEAADELARSKQWYEALVANMSDLVSVHAKDGSLRYASPAAAKLLGRYPEVGTDVSRYVHPEDLEGALAAFAAVATGERGPDEPFAFRILDAGGRYRTLQSIGEDLSGDPAIKGIVVTSRDVTGQVEAERRLLEAGTQLATLVSTLHDGVLFVDDDRRIVVANEAFCRLFCRPGRPDELVGRPAAEARHFAEDLFEDPGEFSKRIDECYRAGVAHLGEELSFSDGRTLERDFLPMPFAGGRRAYLWLFRDVTERKLADAERVSMLKLEREHRAATEQQNKALREVSELKDDFVAMVSHELRTPLTSVVGFTGLLLEEGEALTGEQREFLAAIDRNANRLLRLIGDLLLLARLEAGSQHLAITAVDPAPLVEALVESFAPEAEQRRIGLSCSLAGPPVVYIDSGRIEQVISNLLANACKFSAAGGTVAVAVDHDGDWWVVTVSDDGIGIPLDEQQRVFERFYRASNSRASATPGTGLGLVISRAIVELQGGSVELDSAPGRGTTVAIRLPIREPAAH